MRQLLPFVTGMVTLFGMWAAGNRKWWSWGVGLGNQVLWLWFIVAFDAWGLLFLNVALTFVYTRNMMRWRREDQTAEGR